MLTITVIHKSVCYAIMATLCTRYFWNDWLKISKWLPCWELEPSL